MKVTNVSGSTKSNVRVSRYFDGNLDASAAGDRYARTVDSVWGWEPPPVGHALSLTALTRNVAHSTKVESRGIWFVNSCEGGTDESTPTSPSDFAGRVTYDLGTLKPGQNKIVRVVYRIF
jgi:hypothetical protein